MIEPVIDPVIGALIGPSPTARRLRRAAVLAAGVLAGGLLTGCSGDPGASSAPTGSSPAAATTAPTTTPASSAPPSATSAPARCGPVATDRVRGRRPSYAEGVLTRFRADVDLCAGWWLPRADAGFVPQGLALAGAQASDEGSAWVVGYDGTQAEGQRTCSVERVDLDDGSLQRQATVAGGGRVCHHGGGLVLDAHGLWVAETQRLWLLDPTTLAVVRSWELPEPVRGSFAVRGPGGELGIGSYREDGPGRVYWYDVDRALTLDRLTAADASSSVPAPAYAQGAFSGRIGGQQGLWFALSSPSCGQLVGPDGVRRVFVPGAEGLVLRADGLWAVSESSAQRYQEEGRPLTPMLGRYDAAAVASGPQPSCRL